MGNDLITIIVDDVEVPARADQTVIEACEVKKETPGETEEELVLVRVLEDVPTFAGVDNEYKLRKEDIISLPRAIAGTLVSHGKATLIGSG